jgi:cell division protein FtsI/penicillin-binding protein 2
VGLSFIFNKKLKGEPVIRKYYRDAKGRPVKISETSGNTKSSEIILSIDKEIQAM